MRKLMLVVALAAIAAGPASPVTALAGRYSKHFRNGDVSGASYWSDDVIEIVPVDPNHAYFNVALEFYNGHECSISGVARATGSKLVYREPADGPADGKCTLSISARGKAVLLDDGDGTCKAYCGARGSLTGFDFVPLTSKRPITYMDKIKGSEEYKEAMADLAAGKVK